MGTVGRERKTQVDENEKECASLLASDSRTISAVIKYNINVQSPQDELFCLGAILNKSPWTEEDIQREFAQDYRPWFIKLAKAFDKLPLKLKLRALVEEWDSVMCAVACGIDPAEIPDNRVYGEEDNDG